MLDMYVPHDQDELIQILWYDGKITVKDILDGDCKLVQEREILIVWSPDGFISGGMYREIEAAKKKGIPIIKFRKFNDRVALEILEVIYQIITKKQREGVENECR